MAGYTWQAVEGEFRIRVDIGGFQKELVLDTGFTNPGCAVGLHVSRSTYQRLQSMGAISEQYSCELRLADGYTDITTVGQVEAQILYGSHPIGPRLKTYVIDGGADAEELVGTCFFHHIQGGTLTWDFTSQTITLDIQG